MTWWLNSILSFIGGALFGYFLSYAQSKLESKGLFSIQTMRGIVILVVTTIWAISVISSIVNHSEVSYATSGIMGGVVGYLYPKKGEDVQTDKRKTH